MSSSTEEETMVAVETTEIQTKELISTNTKASGFANGKAGPKRNYSSLEQEDEEEAEDEQEEEEEEYSKPSASKVLRKETCYASYRRIQHTSTNKATVEKGLVHDYKQELHYVLTTLFDEKATVNLKSLSLVQLVKKSVAPEFRDFLRAHPAHLNRLFAVLTELTSSPVISLSAASLLYFMARDRKGVHISEHCVRLISALLKQDQLAGGGGGTKPEEEFAKHVDSIWSIMQEWLRYWQTKKSSSTKNTTVVVKFDVPRESLSGPYLTLEALAYIAIKEQSKLFKSEMLNSGCLTSVVAKLDKVVLELVHSVGPKDGTLSRLKIVERCLRILENAAAFDPKNQNFLIQHRNSLLIFSSAKFLNCCLKFINEVVMVNQEKQQNDKSEQQNECSNKIFDNICLLCRVLMNVSHENENAALKIGQVAMFLGNCLQVLAHYSKHAPKERFFDLAVMMYGLLVNLLEKCAANRRKFIQLKSDFVDDSGELVKDIPSLEILAKLFIRHDSAAKTIDEEFDNDLAADEHEEGGNGQEKAANLSQDEVLAAIQSMMSKASTHMEDSMIASYCSLVVAILVGTDHKLADEVRAFLPDKEMSPMMDQLERFLEFMRITKLKANTVSNIERVLNSFQMASNSTD